MSGSGMSVTRLSLFSMPPVPEFSGWKQVIVLGDQPTSAMEPSFVLAAELPVRPSALKT